VSLFDDHSDEMQTQPLFDEQTMESILAGRSPSGRPELDELASFVTEVKSVASAPAPKVGAQLAAVLAGGLTEKGDLSATAASNVTGPAPQAAGLPKRRESMLETIFAKAVLAKAAAVLGGLTIATTGAAAADLLPGPAQNGVAAVVEAVSPLNVPDSDDKRQDGEHRQVDVADEKSVVPSEQPSPNPNAEASFGSDVSNRAQTTEDKGKDFGQSVRNDAPKADAANDAQKRRPQTAPVQRPATTPTADSNPGTPHRESAPSQPPSTTPTADSNPGSGYRR